MKRLFDLLLLLVLVPFVLPLFTMIYAAARWKLGSDVFFAQERGGFEGKPFTLWKFRSMTNDRDLHGELLPDAERITPFGHFLRSTSLDELPCLLNVARGEMSFVGPRPFMADYLLLYTPEQMRRHSVVPGITGWAQINGRNSLSWEQKFLFDLWYVDHRSLLLDFKILALTVGKVFLRHGISAEGESTMPRFRGTSE